MFRAIRAAFGSLGAEWRSWNGARQARAFDARYGTDTLRIVPVAQMRDIPDARAAHAVHYEASSLPKLRRALAAVTRVLGERLREFAFVDVGSGKGLVVLLAARHPFREVVGVELAPELHAIAQANARRFTAVHADTAPMRFVHADALACSLPEGPLVVYLYNPFDATLLEPFAARLDESVAPDCEILVAYVNPVHRNVFDGSPRYECLWDDRHAVVYRRRPESGA